MNKKSSAIVVNGITTDWLVAVCGMEGTAYEAESIANAALIAIAPEMLEALIAIQEAAMTNQLNAENVEQLISDVFAKLANEAVVCDEEL
jgi:hypothetical protein